MRVLYVIDTLEIGGSERSLLEIASALPTARAEICHVYPGATLRGTFEARGIPVHALDVQERYGFPTAFRRLRRLIAARRPDVVHTTLVRSDIVGRSAARSLGIPVVSSFVNDNYGEVARRRLDRTGRWKRTALQTLDLVTARLGTRFAANSETMKHLHARALVIDPDRIEVIYRGRDPATFSAPPPQEIAALRSTLGLKERRTVLMVARLLERKGQADLIDAAGALTADFPDLVVLLAGDGPYRAALESRVRTRGLEDRVRFLGTRDDVPRLLHLAEVFVTTSEFEGHPGALVEAMLAGRAIAASDIPVHAETIDDGHTGLLFPLHDADRLASTLRALLDDVDLRSRLGEAAARTAVERFDVRRIAARHEALYHRALEAST